ncbi:unnamed protein product [Arctogadus glacialis]
MPRTSNLLFTADTPPPEPSHPSTRPKTESHERASNRLLQEVGAWSTETWSPTEASLVALYVEEAEGKNQVITGIKMFLE